VITESLKGDAKDAAFGQAEFMLDTWRSEIVLTTFDQFLLTLMDAKSRHQQRFNNLCDALIIINEVQAFPVHLWHPVGTLLKLLRDLGRTRPDRTEQLEQAALKIDRMVIPVEATTGTLLDELRGTLMGLEGVAGREFFG